jgi:hypothetical protein
MVDDVTPGVVAADAAVPVTTRVLTVATMAAPRVMAARIPMVPPERNFGLAQGDLHVVVPEHEPSS